MEVEDATLEHVSARTISANAATATATTGQRILRITITINPSVHNIPAAKKASHQGTTLYTLFRISIDQPQSLTQFYMQLASIAPEPGSLHAPNHDDPQVPSSKLPGRYPPLTSENPIDNS